MFLHRMKAYIDKFQPNASQANCFERFWRITSKHFKNVEKWRCVVRSIWDVLILHRMKAYIDKFQPNASQANCFERFWRITSKTNAKIEVRKQ